MAPPTTDWVYLAPNPKSVYRQLFLRGTRIRAEVVYGMTVDGDDPMTPEEVAKDLRLPLEAVREAIAYCRSDPLEIRLDHAREEAVMAATGMNAPDYREGGKYRILSPQERTRMGL